MSSMASTHPTLLSRYLKKGSLAHYALVCITGSLLLVAAAKIKVPFWPVEMTMQTFAVMVIGMTCGWRLGGATVALYLAQGAMGLPVFTGTPEKGIGIAYMAGPTGGYLLGFLLAAVFTGWLAERGWDRSVPKAAAALIGGLVILYVPGILHLGALFGWDKPILEWGLYPFLAGEAFKMALAAAVLPLAWKFGKAASDS
jgi:biotin transport system substrate-specific component